jgi:hypothetical protein
VLLPFVLVAFESAEYDWLVEPPLLLPMLPTAVGSAAFSGVFCSAPDRAAPACPSRAD